MITVLKKEEEFKDLLSKGNVLLKFEASWCGPCKVLNRVIDSLDEKKLNVNFLKVDVDEFSDIAQQYLVSSIPTCFAFIDGKSVPFIKEGKEELSLLGAIEEEDFETILKDTFKL